MVSILAVFPALALRAWRSGGSRKLALFAVGGLAIIAVVALAMGYRVLILYSITLGLPLLMMAAIIRALQPAAGEFAKPYVIAAGAGLVTWALATILSVYLMPSVA